MKKGTVFSLILAPLRGNFSLAGGEQYERLKPLKDSPLLHVCNMGTEFMTYIGTKVKGADG